MRVAMYYSLHSMLPHTNPGLWLGCTVGANIDLLICSALQQMNFFSRKLVRGIIMKGYAEKRATGPMWRTPIAVRTIINETCQACQAYDPQP